MPEGEDKKEENKSYDLSPDLLQQITEFQGKKEDVLKNISLLNTLSERLTVAIADEERKVVENKSKEMLDSKKVTNENELELLHLENKKMDGYLQILQQKQDLELKYLEQLCEQRSRVDKLGEKYPHIDIKHFWTYQEYYNDQIHTSKQRTRKQLGIQKKGKANNRQQNQNQAEQQAAYNQYIQQQQYAQQYQQYLQQQQQQQQYQQYQQFQNYNSQPYGTTPAPEPTPQQSSVVPPAPGPPSAPGPPPTENSAPPTADVNEQQPTRPNPPPPVSRSGPPSESDGSAGNPAMMPMPMPPPPGPTSNFPVFPLLNEINNSSISNLRRASMPVTRNEHRGTGGGLQDHLSMALDTKFQNALRVPQDGNDDSDDDDSFLSGG